MRCGGGVGYRHALAETPRTHLFLRGVTVVGGDSTCPKADLHSGIYGGSVDNPALVLCQMLAALRDKRGRIAVPGFYDRGKAHAV